MSAVNARRSIMAFPPAGRLTRPAGAGEARRCGQNSLSSIQRSSPQAVCPPMRLKDKIAVVVGAGQSPGEGMGNGRATALTFAREGAHVLCVDHNLASAQETVDLIGKNQG